MSFPKVAICVPYYRTVEGATMMSAMALSAASAAHVGMFPIFVSGCYIEDNRNGCIKFAKASGIPFDWVLWIDGDMRFPADTLVRLIAHNKDIVGANYRQRVPPYHSVAHYLDNSQDHMSEPGLHRMAQMPTGLLLTRWEIYERMPFPWFPASVIEGEPRDDVAFCRHARAMGYEIWADHDLSAEVTHISTQMIPWFNPGQVVKVRGAEINSTESETATHDRARLAAKTFHDAALAAD